MKIQMTMFVAITGGLMLAIGCSKKEEAPAPPPPSAAAPANAIQKAADTAKAQTEVVKDAAAEVAATTQGQAEAASSKVRDLTEQARKLLGENKPSDALSLLNQLTALKLTPEQQALVQSLKEQAQKAIEAALKTKASDEATKAVGGLVQPKK